MTKGINYKITRVAFSLFLSVVVFCGCSMRKTDYIYDENSLPPDYPVYRTEDVINRIHEINNGLTPKEKPKKAPKQPANSSPMVPNNSAH